jgi:hypothetical protein
MQLVIIRRLSLFVAVILLSALGGRADEVKPGGGVAPQCENAVRDMARRLSSARAFTFNAYTCRQQFLNDGQRVEFSHNQHVAVRRPDRIAASVQGDEGDSEFTFDGRTVTLFNARDHVYGRTEIEGDLQKLFDTLASRYGMTLPLVDLVLPDPSTALLSRVRTCDDLGLGYVFDVKCRHLAFRQDGVDWEIWIQEGNDPLPRKLVITYKEAPGTPQYVAYLSDWNLAADIPESRFTFHAPEGAKQVDFAVPASQVRPAGTGASK